MFSRYYQSELTYLREMGRAFGQANPRVAGLLAERGGDPDVERLLEGFAFLTARIRERMDDAVPEIIHGLCDLLLPHYLKTLPAASIVEFTPQARALRGRVKVPAGVELAANPVEGTSCVFRTTFDIDLLPVTLTESVLDTSVAAAPVIRLQFQTTEQGRAEVFQPQGLRLFIQAEPAVGGLILLWLLRHCRGVQVRNGAGKSVRLPPTAIVPVGLKHDFPLFPWPRLAPEGFRLVQEYFTLPQKLLFFDVRGLDMAREVDGDRFELAFEFDRPPALPARLGRDTFRLHCVPVINLFQTSSDPVIHKTLDEEHMLRAAGVDPLHMEIYSVDGVTGLRQGHSERRVFKPFFDFGHEGPAKGEEEEAFFRVRRTVSAVNEGIDTHLAIGTPRDVSPKLGEETLSLDITCTNRALPARLQIGDICAATQTSPTVARFRNIIAVSRPVRPPLGSELHWRLLSHLALNQRSLADPTALRALLSLYNFQALGDDSSMADAPVAEANRLRIEAITGVDVRSVTRFVEGTPVRGKRVVVDVNEAGFAGVGDAFLLGAVLDELLASHVTLNSFSELALRLQPSKAEYSWPPRNGYQPIF